MAARMPMMAITVSNSIKVNPAGEFRFLVGVGVAVIGDVSIWGIIVGIFMSWCLVARSSWVHGVHFDEVAINGEACFWGAFSGFHIDSDKSKLHLKSPSPFEGVQQAPGKIAA